MRDGGRPLGSGSSRQQRQRRSTAHAGPAADGAAIAAAGCAPLLQVREPCSSRSNSSLRQRRQALLVSLKAINERQLIRNGSTMASASMYWCFDLTSIINLIQTRPPLYPACSQGHADLCYTSASWPRAKQGVLLSGGTSAISYPQDMQELHPAVDGPRCAAMRCMRATGAAGEWAQACVQRGAWR